MPAPFIPVLPVPAAPLGPVGASLNQAYGTIVRTSVADPASAQRANFWYAQAQQRAAAGDVSGALAAAAAAQAAASAPLGPGAALTEIRSSVLQPLQFPAGPLAGSVVGPAALLPSDLLEARSEIALASRAHPGAALDAAKKRYRNALNAYLSGNVATERAEARAARALAAETLAKPK